MSMKKLVRESLNEFLGKSKEKREDIDVHKLRDELESIKERLRYLSNTHHPLDDNPWGSGTVRDMRNRLTHRRKQIRNLLETPEEAKKRMGQEDKAAEKRYAKQKEIEKQREEKLKTLTPKQEAINKLVDLQYQRSEISTEFRSFKWKGRPDKEYYDSLNQRWREITRKMDEIKKEFNLKSYDIKRQKEYDPEYDE